MWNLEKWYRRNYLQGRNREEDIVKGPMGARGWVGMNQEIGLTYEHHHVYER